MHPLLEDKLIHEHHRDLEQEIKMLELVRKTGSLKVFLPKLFRKNKKQ